jgi:hypothetical protein
MSSGWFTHQQFALAPENQFVGPDKISPVYQSVVAINNDTLYASSPIDVRLGPVVVRVPASSRVGYSVLLLDKFGNVYTSGVPSRADRVPPGAAKSSGLAEQPAAVDEGPAVGRPVQPAVR